MIKLLWGVAWAITLVPFIGWVLGGPLELAGISGCGALLLVAMKSTATLLEEDHENRP